MGSVGAVEAFWEDDEGGAGAGGLEDFGASAGEVVSFVGAYNLEKEGLVLGPGIEMAQLPVANCTRASLSGFLRRPAIRAASLCSSQ